MRLPRTGPRTQSASLIALGAFAIHQLRYLIVASGNGSGELPGPGSGYLTHAVPVLAGLALAAISASLARGAISGRAPSTERRLRATSYALAIAAVFCCQQLLEGVLCAGHATGLAAIFSAGGWAALPLAAIFGVLAALIDRGIEAIESGLGPRPARIERAPSLLRLPTTPAKLGRRLSPLALGLAQRPPPAHR